MDTNRCISMAIIIRCVCGQELNELGGLLFSPPYDFTEVDVCVKYHLCEKCYNDVLFFLGLE